MNIELLGKVFFDERTRLGLSLDRAARYLGITPNHLLEVEAGKQALQPEQLVIICRLYSIDFDNLPRDNY